MYRARYIKDSNFEALKIIEPVVTKHNLTLLETAMRWLIHHSELRTASSKEKGDDGIVLGVSSYEQLVTNVENCEKGPLPEEVVEALNKGWEVARGDAVTYWR